MPKHQESAAKQATRHLLLQAAKHLNRPELTYMGMPAETALDILTLRTLLRNVICIADRQAVLDETRRTIASLSLKERKFICADVWEYLKKEYPSEQLIADITFLDFYGGGIRTDDPFSSEIAGLRSFFAKQAAHTGRAFVLAWTYMPRDKGEHKYIETLGKMLPKEDIDLLKSTRGVTLRSLAVRLLLVQQAKEHDLRARLFQHALYKRVMNTIIVVFSRGHDLTCSLSLDDPRKLRSDPCCVYDGQSLAPRLMPLMPHGN
jgi:hypothetical protein